MEMIWDILVFGLVGHVIIPAVMHPLITIPALIGLTGLAIRYA